MAKKKLILNESVTRRFMKLATITPNIASNFLREAEEEMEPEEEPALDPEMGEMEVAEMEPDMEEQPVAEEEEAEDAVMDLLTHIQQWAESKGVSMELQGDEDLDAEAPEDDMAGMEMDAELEGGDTELPAEDEMPEDAEGNYGKMMEEADEDLNAASVDIIDENAIVAEVTKRVARRLLRESAKRK